MLKNLLKKNIVQLFSCKKSAQELRSSQSLYANFLIDLKHPTGVLGEQHVYARRLEKTTLTIASSGGRRSNNCGKKIRKKYCEPH